mgnify:CR=1 FL=1
MTAQDSFNYQSPASSLQGSDETAYTWKPLEFLNAYRFLISVFLAALIYTDTLFAPLGSTNPLLFLATTVGYLALSLVYAPMLHWHKPVFRFQVSLQLLTDIVATILLMHASGGVSSGVGNLLIIAVAGGSIVLQGRHALLFAAVASFAVLGEQFYEHYQQITRANTYTQAGLLGLTLFVTAVLAHLFARRIRESEALAKKRGVDLAELGVDIRRDEQEEGRLVCTCFGLTEPYIERKIKELELKTIPEITNAIKAGGACMSCHHTPGGLQDTLNKVWGQQPTAFKSLPVLPMTREPRAEPPREMSPFKFAKLVETMLEEHVRPQLAKDGGDIEIVDILRRTTQP